MLLISSLALLASGSLPATPVTVETALFQTRPLLGGYRAADVNDEGVQTAARTAAESVDAEVSEVTSAERQTVQGANYKISFTTTDGRSYHAVVYSGLDRSWRVTSIEETSTDTGSNESAESGEDE